MAGIGSGLAEGLVGTALDVLGEVALGDLGEARSKRGTKTESGGNGLDGLAGLLVLGGVGLFDLVGLAGEDDQAGLVGLEALDIGGKGLLGEVGTAGVDGNADGGSIKLGDTGGLELSEGETTAEACPAVILDGAAQNLVRPHPPLHIPPLLLE